MIFASLFLLLFFGVEGLLSVETNLPGSDLLDKKRKSRESALHPKNTDTHSYELKELKMDFVMETMENHFPLLAAAFQDYNIADAELLSAKGSFDGAIKSNITSSSGYYLNQRFDTMVEQPTTFNGTSFFAGYRLGQGKFPVYYGERETNKYGEVRAGARIPIFRNRSIDKGRASIKQSEIGMRLADLSVTGQKLEIYRNALMKYWDWIASVEKYKIAQSIYRIAEIRQNQITRRVKEGDLALIEQIDNERILLQREAQLLSAEQNMNVAANELSLFLRIDKEKKIQPTLNLLPQGAFDQMKDPEGMDIEKQVNFAMENRPDLLRFKAQKDINRIEKELAKNQIQPGIDLVFMASQDMGPGSETRSKPELDANIVLNIPLQTRTQRGKIKGVDAKNKKLEEQEKYMRDRIGADIKNIYSFLNVTRERALLAKREVELADQLEKAELDKFKIGEGTLILVNIREQTLAEAKNREIDALSDHKKTIVNFYATLADLKSLRK
ncbi:MAG: TolC family protein [Leptospiraceae bacterium]|nr:TolC family protein [Leptospiraceae bacterium]MCP5511595.1 TolC family protein [Leptospiraceae bacterium]